ncbi:hypothetical protein [Aureimonas glaciei]|uniref:Uncharacterized protein n=1 Tax=Aureimonas glaciei TaxID=1776957 RepID=A0A916Y8M2_9HYPH|nr:hypothetical protein [Aureimonas glaciei]GGD34736.1 hypothetical protein GCM10011335_42210 [Aureimonas glaciei]
MTVEFSDHSGMEAGSGFYPHHKALRGLTASELQTLLLVHAHQLGSARGAKLSELDDIQRQNFKVLLTKRLADFVLAPDGTWRCIPTRMGRGVLTIWELHKLMDLP